jgi:hypothetical protein
MHQTFTPTQDRTPLSIRLKLRLKDGFAQTQDCLRTSRFALAGSSLPTPQPVMPPFVTRFRVSK